MHDKFADWYRIATPGTEGTLQAEALERLWGGVEAAVGSLGDGQELEVVRLLLQEETQDESFAGSFRTTIKKADSTFSMHGNDLELSVLAGTVVMQVMAEGEELPADRAALAILCSQGFPSLVNRPWVSAFLGEARRYFAERVQDLRKPSETPPMAVKPDGINSAVDALTNALPTGDWGGRVASSMKAAFSAVAKALEEFSRSTAQALEGLIREQALRKEESDILWWLTADYSRDLDYKMSEVKAPGACLVAGKELADMVMVPGPLPAKSFLDRVLTSAGEAYGKAVELKSAVNATPANWRTALSKRPGIAGVSDLCPVLGAVLASLSTEREAEWLPAYKKAYQVNPKLKVSALELSIQMYRECLLLKAAREL